MAIISNVPSHYETLGIDPGATEEQIKGAYRALVRTCHPDVNPEASAHLLFLQVQEAYEVLTDPQRRQAYDGILKMNVQTTPQDNPMKADGRREKELREAEQLRLKAEAMMREFRESQQVSRVDEERLRGLMNAGQYHEAEEAALTVLQSNAKSAVAYAVLGDVAIIRGDRTKAAKFYAFAAQYEPTDTTYQKQYEELLSARPEPKPSEVRYDSEKPNTALLIGAFCVVVMAFYIALNPERPIATGFLPGLTLGAWTMLPLAGTLSGLALCAGGAIGRCDLAQGTTVARISPLVLFSLLSLVSFWIALLYYLVTGFRQQTFNRSLSILVGTTVALVVLFGLAGLSKGPSLGLAIVLFGSNLLSVFQIFGWILTSRVKYG